MCAGAIDGTHIAIATPHHNHVAYVNRKSCHSIVMQGVVDGHYMFRDIVVGWPGSVHNARVFSNSEFLQSWMQWSVVSRGCARDNSWKADPSCHLG